MSDLNERVVIGSARNTVGLLEPAAIDDAHDEPERAVLATAYLREALELAEFLGWDEIVVGVETGKPLSISQWGHGFEWGAQQADIAVAPRILHHDELDPREVLGLESDGHADPEEGEEGMSQSENPNSPSAQLREAADRLLFASDHVRRDEAYAALAGKEEFGKICRDMASIARQLALLAEAVAEDDIDQGGSDE